MTSPTPEQIEAALAFVDLFPASRPRYEITLRDAYRAKCAELARREEEFRAAITNAAAEIDECARPKGIGARPDGVLRDIAYNLRALLPVPTSPPPE
jgi:hypothetical protein